jgi:aminopeptidase N
MTDRQGALMVLPGSTLPERDTAAARFLRALSSGNALVIDKWFTLQALSLHPDVLEHVQGAGRASRLHAEEPQPRALAVHGLCGQPQGLPCKASGEGYRMVADLILALDPINPQTAARFVPRWAAGGGSSRARAALMKAELERIMAAGNLSRDTFEQVSRSLG